MFEFLVVGAVGFDFGGVYDLWEVCEKFGVWVVGFGEDSEDDCCCEHGVVESVPVVVCWAEEHVAGGFACEGSLDIFHGFFDEGVAGF